MSKNKVKFQMPPIGAQHAKQAVSKGVEQINNPVTREQVTQQVTEMIQQSGMPVEMFVEIGKLCEDAINDKKKYSKFVDYMVNKRLESRESLKKPDFQMLASMVVIGKVAETMVGQNPTEPVQPVQPEGL